MKIVCKITKIAYSINDTHREKLYLNQYKNGCLAFSDLFHILTQSIKFYTFNSFYTFEKYDSSNRQ